MDIAPYLRRIRYDGPRTPDAETLRALHRAHLLAVPFENLDIHLGRPIVLDEGAFFEKIVRANRGGFCYELNGLFASLLRALGFRVSLLSARVFTGPAPGPEFDHMALLVALEKPWLADVGFGDSFLEPLPLDRPGEGMHSGVRYRAVQEGEVREVMSRRPDAEWAPMYRFDLAPRQLEDFAPMCRWQQTSPDSHFTQKRVCTLATPEGRVTLSGMKLIVTENGRKRERPVPDDRRYVALLREHFGVDLGGAPRWTARADPPGVPPQGLS